MVRPIFNACVRQLCSQALSFPAKRNRAENRFLIELRVPQYAVQVPDRLLLTFLVKRIRLGA